MRCSCSESVPFVGPLFLRSPAKRGLFRNHRLTRSAEAAIFFFNIYISLTPHWFLTDDDCYMCYFFFVCVCVFYNIGL